MKCEIKCIKNDLKEDFRGLDLKSALIIALIPIAVTGVFRILLGNYIFIYVSTILSLVIFAYFILLGYFTWKDAVDYCRNRKIKTQNNSPGIHHG